MHTDLAETIIARRLRAAADDSSEPPYDWAEFQRRGRRRSTATALVGRDRSLAVAASVVAALLVTAVAIVRSSHRHAPARAPQAVVARSGLNDGVGDRGVGDRAEQVATSPAHTRAIEGWLAGLPRDPTVVRVGAHAAVSSLQDQIAALDDLMSAERVAGAAPSRLGALERQRAQLVSSLAQLRYAELLASSTP
ncbi:MAG TPA: hypothetical protein VJ738_10050 [Steroidobacteraceae bacterium]|nr:hypothetical protein [Steroidobacteraceae bacterium]